MKWHPTALSMVASAVRAFAAHFSYTSRSLTDREFKHSLHGDACLDRCSCFCGCCEGAKFAVPGGSPRRAWSVSGSCSPPPPPLFASCCGPGWRVAARARGRGLPRRANQCHRQRKRKRAAPGRNAAASARQTGGGIFGAYVRALSAGSRS